MVEVWFEARLSRPWVQAKDVILELRILHRASPMSRVIQDASPEQADDARAAAAGEADLERSSERREQL